MHKIDLSLHVSWILSDNLFLTISNVYSKEGDNLGQKHICSQKLVHKYASLQPCIHECTNIFITTIWKLLEKNVTNYGCRFRLISSVDILITCAYVRPNVWFWRFRRNCSTIVFQIIQTSTTSLSSIEFFIESCCNSFFFFKSLQRIWLFTLLSWKLDIL